MITASPIIISFLLSLNCNFPQKCLVTNYKWDYCPKSRTRLYMFDDFIKFCPPYACDISGNRKIGQNILTVNCLHLEPCKFF